MLPQFNEKYGKVIGDPIAIEDEKRTFSVALIEQRGERWLDIRSIYYRQNEPHFGKGVRIPTSLTEDVLIAAEALVLRESV